MKSREKADPKVVTGNTSKRRRMLSWPEELVKKGQMGLMIARLFQLEISR